MRARPGMSASMMLLLLLVATAHGLSIITRNMIRTPDEIRSPSLEKHYEPVPLEEPDGSRYGNAAQTPDTQYRSQTTSPSHRMNWQPTKTSEASRDVRKTLGELSGTEITLTTSEESPGDGIPSTTEYSLTPTPDFVVTPSTFGASSDLRNIVYIRVNNITDDVLPKVDQPTAYPVSKSTREGPALRRESQSSSPNPADRPTNKATVVSFSKVKPSTDYPVDNITTLGVIPIASRPSSNARYNSANLPTGAQDITPTDVRHSNESPVKSKSAEEIFRSTWSTAPVPGNMAAMSRITAGQPPNTPASFSPELLQLRDINSTRNMPHSSKVQHLSVSNVTILRPVNTSKTRTTVLQPVGRLWQREERSDTQLWSLLQEAYLCLFAGIQCFSERLLPMVRSYIGISPPSTPSHYLLPRGEEARRLGGRGGKELLLALLLVKTVLLPWIVAAFLTASKALLTALLSLAAAGGVASLPQHSNYYM